MIPHSCPSIGDEEVAAVERVLRSGRLAQGPEVEAFEAECAAFVGHKHGVAVNSGVAALHLALGAAGVTGLDEVALPSYACAALITAVQLQGARPRLCDIGPDHNLDSGQVRADSKAVILPHLFGAPAAIPKAGIVIEDIAQSIGGPTGKATPLCIASFYATKLLTTGEGGMVLTDDEAMATYVRDRRDYDNRDDFADRNNYKMTDFQAALGRVQLKRLPGFIARRREIAAEYEAAFAGLPLGLPDGEGHVFFRYVVTTDRREALENHLQAAGVDAKRPVYRPAHHYFQGAFPMSERAHEQCLSLPLFPSMVAEQADHVIKSVKRLFE